MGQPRVALASAVLTCVLARCRWMSELPVPMDELPVNHLSLPPARNSREGCFERVASTRSAIAVPWCDCGVPWCDCGPISDCRLIVRYYLL
jgi:hypothetical protein